MLLEKQGDTEVYSNRVLEQDEKNPNLPPGCQASVLVGEDTALQ